MSVHVGSRYLEGLLLAEYKSVELWGDDEKDCLIKRLFAQAQQDDITKFWDCVIFTEVEIIAIKEDGTDTGNMEGCREVYRFPFVQDPSARKYILRAVVDNFNATMNTTPLRYW